MTMGGYWMGAALTQALTSRFELTQGSLEGLPFLTE